MKYLLMASVFVGCTPFSFEAPYLTSFNGIPIEKPKRNLPVRPTIELDPFVRGETQFFEAEIDAPKGVEVLLWWPNAPLGLDFPPEATQGQWTPGPETTTSEPYEYFTLIVEGLKDGEHRYTVYSFYSQDVSGGGPSGL